MRLRLWQVPLGLAWALLYCEFLHYYVILGLWCGWGSWTGATAPLRVMFIADTHLLGVRRGHWFDKLRREWQMHRAFVSAVTLHGPDLVFVLGDLFDEGQWSGPAEFATYAARLDSLFPVTAPARRFVVPGNHDVGFHYSIWPQVLERFQTHFDALPVRLLSVRGVHFVLLNSMALEKDGCRLCQTAEKQLKELNSTFACMIDKSVNYRCDFLLGDVTESKDNRDGAANLAYSRPILLQHFPLFRATDAHCEEADSGSAKEKAAPMREKWDVLSRESTDAVLRQLRPRAAFDGHSHNGCRSRHGDMWEWTVSSFSWRNRPNPGLLLASISPEHLQVEKCLLPDERSVIAMYVFAAAATLAALAARLPCRPRLPSWRKVKV